jgi:AbrB family looped-hinge helix DNA binding protein
MDSYIIQLSSKGQVTLPSGIRKKLGLSRGSKLFVVIDEDEIRMKAYTDKVPVFSEKSSFHSLIGSFSGPADLSEKHNQYVAEEEK